MLPFWEVIMFMAGVALVYFPTVHFTHFNFHLGDYPFMPAIGIALIIVGAIFGLLRIFLAICGIIRLNRQEKMLGFDFSDEMRKNNITTTRHVTPKWFIDVRHGSSYQFAFIVLKRDFIKNVSKVNMQESATSAPARTSVIIITGDGKKQKIWTSFSKNKDIIYDFAKWYRNKKSFFDESKAMEH